MSADSRSGKAGATPRHAVNATPLDTLKLLHEQIRAGTFRRDMLQTVRQLLPKWKEAGDADCLQGVVVASEVFDYFGEYRAARLALRGHDLAETLSYLSSSTLKGKEPPNFKRVLWVVLAHAQMLYREEEYARVRELVKTCSTLLARVDRKQERFFGTRGRLSYLSGQVRRQLSDYDDAIRAFGESIEFAGRRLREKTPFAEFVAEEEFAPTTLALPEREAKFLYAGRLANWTIARSLALGIGWIYYVTGRLSDSSRCLAVGSTLLRSTQDSVHRAYCELLSGAVQRARSAHDPEALSDSLAVMIEASKGLSHHPLFSLRAHYEIALAWLHKDDLAQAENVIQTLEQSISRLDSSGTGRSLRWNCQLLVLKSRLSRKRKDHATARTIALKARELVKGAQQASLEAEALIACAEAVLSSEAVDELEFAASCLSEARSLARTNPKIGAACCLHLATLNIRRARFAEARNEFKRWDYEYRPLVEHGFVRQMARSVERQLWSSDGDFRVSGTNFDANALRLKAMLVDRVLAIPGLTRQEQAQRLGLKHPRDVTRWIQECERHNLIQTTKNTPRTKLSDV